MSLIESFHYDTRTLDGADSLTDSAAQKVNHTALDKEAHDDVDKINTFLI